MSVLSMFTSDLAIDLGTANTCVFAQGRGIVLNEPSIVAFNTAKGEVEAVGTEAHEMLGRTPPNIRAVRPLRDGVIADFDAAEKMLVHFVRKAMGRLSRSARIEGNRIGRMSRQVIRYVTTSDGVRLAWAEAGAGQHLVKASNWLSHLEYEWDSPIFSHWMRFLRRR